MQNESSDSHNKKTRDIYQKQHERLVSDNVALTRIRNMYSPEKFELPDGKQWFSGKTAADIGCGNVGALLSALHEWGCESSIAIDVGNDWMPTLESALEEQGVKKDWCEMRSGSVLDIPIESNEIDFVSINGVLIHLRNMGEILRGFNEGARVCKKDGYYFTSYGPCGGLMQGAILPAVRSFYHEDSGFKSLIDRISVKDIHQIIDKIVDDTNKFSNQDLDEKFLKNLFGTDFCVFLQNFVQAPSWLSNECTPEVVEELYKANGFTDIKRLGGYVDRTDIRKYFAALHNDRDYWFSKIMYGQGYVQYIAKKA